MGLYLIFFLCVRGAWPPCVERLARDFIGGLSSTERVMTLSLVVTYCLRSIITIANEVSSIMSANTPASDSTILIISSSINIFG